MSQFRVALSGDLKKSGHADVIAVGKIMQGQVPTGIVNRDIEKSETWRSHLASYRKLFG